MEGTRSVAISLETGRHPRSHDELHAPGFHFGSSQRMTAKASACQSYPKTWSVQLRKLVRRFTVGVKTGGRSRMSGSR